MLISTRAIVLTTRAYNDKFAIAHLLTEEEGMVAYKIPKPSPSNRRSSATARLQRMVHPLSELSILADHRLQRGLQQIDDAEYYRLSLNLMLYDQIKVNIAYFLAEALYHILRSAPPDPEVYRYISRSIEALEESEKSCANFPITFLFGLLEPLGVLPPDVLEQEPKGYFDLVEASYTMHPLRSSHVIPIHETKALRYFRRINYQNMHLFRFHREERQRILTYLLDYLRLHYAPIGELSSPTILSLLHS